MRKNRLLVLITFVAAVSQMPAYADGPGREFSAEAVVNSREGRSRMLVTLVADRFTSVEEARDLARLLERGQGPLVNALRGRHDGRVRLGALEMPVALVVAEPVGRDGYRFIFLTPRRIEFHEREFDEESLDYPFGIVVFEVDRFGRGEGDLHVAAALSIDQDGHIEIEDYNGADGRVERIKQVR